VTNRQRISAALHFQPVDSIPWAPRWELWFSAASRDGRLPERYRGWAMWDVACDLGMGIKSYGVRPYIEVRTGVDVSERQVGVDLVQAIMCRPMVFLSRYGVLASYCAPE